VSELSEKGVAFKVTDDPSIDTTSRTGKLVMGILALIAEFENDIRRERQMDGIAKAKDRGVRFGRKPELTPERVCRNQMLRKSGATVPEIIRQTRLSKASIYRALGGWSSVEPLRGMSALSPIAGVRRARLKSPLRANSGHQPSPVQRSSLVGPLKSALALAPSQSAVCFSYLISHLALWLMI
jgi:Resolvase, N terminal domain